VEVALSSFLAIVVGQLLQPLYSISAGLQTAIAYIPFLTASVEHHSFFANDDGGAYSTSTQYVHL